MRKNPNRCRDCGQKGAKRGHPGCCRSQFSGGSEDFSSKEPMTPDFINGCMNCGQKGVSTGHEGCTMQPFQSKEVIFKIGILQKQLEKEVEARKLLEKKNFQLKEKIKQMDLNIQNFKQVDEENKEEMLKMKEKIGDLEKAKSLIMEFEYDDCEDFKKLLKYFKSVEKRRAELKIIKEGVKRKLTKLKKANSQFICPTCQKRKKNMVFNCGHTSCSACSEKLDVCPICSLKITDRKKLIL